MARPISGEEVPVFLLIIDEIVADRVDAIAGQGDRRPLARRRFTSPSSFFGAYRPHASHNARKVK
jgi:hypothetical protein